MSVELRTGFRTHAGRVRRINQDSLLADVPVFAVADGMGGHAAGEVASAIAIDLLRSTLAGADATTTAQVVNAVKAANVEILRQSLSDAELRGMGTTLSAVALVTDGGVEEVSVVNVGDSRTYLCRSGELTQITRDHTYVEDLVAAGQITAAEARVHPQRHIITRVLGVEPDVEVDTWLFAAVPGDRYVVCSDGLCNEVDDATIAQTLTDVDDPQAVADHLVSLALDFGGRDNITVIVVDVLRVEAGEIAPPGALLPETPDGGRVEDTMAMAAAADAEEAVGGWLPPDAFTSADADTLAFQPPPALAEAPLVAAAGAPAVAAVPAAPAPVVSPKRAPRPGDPPPETREAREAKRRRRRRVSTATVVTLLGLLVIAAVAIGSILWVGRSGYYAAFTPDGRVAVFQGRYGGVLWVQPTLETVYPLSRNDLSPTYQSTIDNRVDFTSLEAADRWYLALSQNPNAVPALTTTTAAPTTTAPPTTVAPTTAPPSTAAGP